MGNIKQLSTKVSNLIAAGEVVENIPSILKELIENSIDANSTSIEIKLIESGLKSITIIDNGSGMDKEDLNLCILRHATSKIVSEHDLFRLNTLGFRGEAIPSIASVSDLTISSHYNNETSYINVKGNKVISKGDSQYHKGTIITIKDIFYNTPARLKQISNSKKQLNLSLSLIEDFILSNPNISFKLINDNKILIHSRGNNDIKEAIFKIYNKTVLNSMYYLSANIPSVDIKGYISNINCLKKNTDSITIVINNRIIKNKLIQHSIVEGYTTLIPKGSYPYVLLYINIDPVLLDINIHPKKQDIKISNINDVKKLITNSINKLLSSNDLTYTYSIIEEKSNPIENGINEVSTSTTTINYKNLVESNTISFDYRSTKEDIAKYNPKQEIDFLNYIGTYKDTYLLCEGKDSLYLVDQHAAEERINYEIIISKFKKESLEVLTLLSPIVYNYKSSEIDILLSNKDKLLSFGVLIEENIDNSIIVREIPSFISDSKVELDIILNSILYNKDLDFINIRDYIAKQVACKSSIKANYFINTLEVDTLLNRLIKCDNPFTCPHGRPSIVKFTNYEIEKLFKRVM